MPPTEREETGIKIKIKPSKLDNKNSQKQVWQTLRALLMEIANLHAYVQLLMEIVYGKIICASGCYEKFIVNCGKYFYNAAF